MRKVSEETLILQIDISEVVLEKSCLKIKTRSKHAICRKLKCTNQVNFTNAFIHDHFYSESNIVMQVFKNTCIILIPLKSYRICVPKVHKPQNQNFAITLPKNI